METAIYCNEYCTATLRCFVIVCRINYLPSNSTSCLRFLFSPTHPSPLSLRSLLLLDTIFRIPSMIAFNSSIHRSINSISFHQSLFRIHFHNLKLSLVLERLSSGNPGVLAGRFCLPTIHPLNLHEISQSFPIKVLNSDWINQPSLNRWERIGDKIAWNKFMRRERRDEKVWNSLNSY